MVKYRSPPVPDADLEKIFAAVANPVRRSMVETLVQGERSISELAEPFDMTLVGVSKHVRVLAEAGLVRVRRSGRRKLCQLDPKPLVTGGRWMAEICRFWADELAQVERFVSGEPAGGGQTAG